MNTHLERNQPHALGQIPHEREILKRLDTRRILINVQKRQTHEPLIPVQALGVHFGPIRVQEVAVHVGDGRYGVTGRVFGAEFQAPARGFRVGGVEGYCLDYLEYVCLRGISSAIAGT